MAGVKISPPNSLLYALIVDELRSLRWGFMGNKKHMPTSVTEIMANGLPEKGTQGFDTAEEYERKRREIIERING